MVGAATMWSIYGLAQKQLLRSMPSEHIMVCIYVGCARGFTPLASPAAIADVDGVVLAVLAFCALNTAVAYGAFAEALEHWEASRVSAVLALTPLATLAAATATSHLWPRAAVGQGVVPWASLGGSWSWVPSSLRSRLEPPRVGPSDATAAPRWHSSRRRNRTAGGSCAR